MRVRIPLPAFSMDYLKSYIKEVPDFPKKGISFKDLSPLFFSNSGFKDTIELLATKVRMYDIDHIAGIEARGFILGAALANYLRVGFIPIRKAGKLPPPIRSIDYDLEYGSDSLCIVDGVLGELHRVLVVDDLIATGGTAKAACDLIQGARSKVVAAAFVVELTDLKGIEKLDVPNFSLVKY